MQKSAKCAKNVQNVQQQTIWRKYNINQNESKNLSQKREKNCKTKNIVHFMMLESNEGMGELKSLNEGK
jgi:hypothetical protein